MIRKKKSNSKRVNQYSEQPKHATSSSSSLPVKIHSALSLAQQPHTNKIKIKIYLIYNHIRKSVGSIDQNVNKWENHTGELEWRGVRGRWSGGIGITDDQAHDWGWLRRQRNPFCPTANVTGKLLSKVIECCKKHVEASKSDNRATTGIDDDLKAWEATLFDLILDANYPNIKIQELAGLDFARLLQT